MVSFLEWIVLVSVIYLLIKIIKLQEDITGMKNTLNQIANQMELSKKKINDD